MKTAIECLTENDINILAFPDNYLEYIKAAMQEYAQQEAIEFGNWKDKLHLDEKIAVNPPRLMTNKELYKKYQDEKLATSKG